MKRSIRLYITGNLQSIFFRNFIKENAEKFNIKGFLRNLEDGRIEIFIEGNSEEVESMSAICKRGPKYSQIRKVEEKEEKFQDFKEFKILRF